MLEHISDKDEDDYHITGNLFILTHFSGNVTTYTSNVYGITSHINVSVHRRHIHPKV